MGHGARRLPKFDWEGASRNDVDLIRVFADYSMELGGRLASPLVALIGKHVARALEDRHHEPGLREWHSLALDVAAGLPEGSERAELSLIIAELRKTILLAQRNPADRLASRPTSRRVLDALRELGAHGKHGYGEVRNLTGQSQSHFSNILRALHAHGFVCSSADPGDGRERRLWLTEDGRAAIEAHERGPRRIFTSIVHRRPARQEEGQPRRRRYFKQVRSGADRHTRANEEA